MLTDISVRGLGVIEDVRAEFGPGLTALTGETGAGKTLVVEALGLLVGGRADPALVRPGSPALEVEGRFEVDDPSVFAAVGDLGVLGDDLDGEVLLSRQVPSTGRSRAWANGRMATAATLALWGSALLDLHGQHDHMSLTTPLGQRSALDSFSGVDLDEWHAARRELAEVSASLAALGGDPDERQREADFIGYQLDELDRAGIDDPSEEARLAEEEEVLAAADAHRDAALRSLMAIGSADTEPGSAMTLSASDSLGTAIAFLTGHAPFALVEERLRALAEELHDTIRDLRATLDTVREDPERLSEVRERRRLLFDIARKYGGTLDAARAYRDGARERLCVIERHDADARELTVRLRDAEKRLASAETALRTARTAAAPQVARAVTSRLRTLAMPKATVEVSVSDEGTGEPVAFHLGANPGEPVLPLSKVASGGELARATLAVRLVTSGGPPTLVFDEVDAGIGGEAALAVGRALAQLATECQVIVVTHLAQVAAFADRHLRIAKSTRGGRTVATVDTVEGADRVVELSRMLSGQPDSPVAHRHAEELLSAAAEHRSTRRAR